MNIGQLNKIIMKSGFVNIGLRVMTNDVKVKVGELLDNSFEWVDGDPTDNELDGTCALTLKYDGYEVNENWLNKMLDNAKDYITNDEQLVIIGGSDSYEGNDLNEIVISDAHCIAII